MLVTVTGRDPDAQPDSGAGEWVRVDLAEQPTTELGTAPADDRLSEALLRAVDASRPTIVVSEDRALVSAQQIERAARAGSNSGLVVSTATVTDTVRAPTGEIVDRDELVEVCSPLVIGPKLATRLLAEDLVAGVTSVVDVILVAQQVGADITTIADDGSGAWVGRSDAMQVARARVEP